VIETSTENDPSSPNDLRMEGWDFKPAGSEALNVSENDLIFCVFQVAQGKKTSGAKFKDGTVYPTLNSKVAVSCLTFRSLHLISMFCFAEKCSME
jgi:hypothetical protein